MASPLSLFPSPQASLPRNFTKSKPQRQARSPAPGELRGIAMQVIASPPRIQPAQDHIKHSLFCEPSTTTTKFPERTSSRSPLVPRRWSHSSNTTPPPNTTSPQPNEDQLSPLPCETSPSRPRRPRGMRSAAPATLTTKTPVGCDVSIENDQLSPLPDKTKFNTRTSPPVEFPSPISSRAASPSLRWNNSATSRSMSPSNEDVVPMRSIFPQYDMTKPVNQQHYYPTMNSPAQSLPSDKVSKAGSPVEKKSVSRFDSAVALVDGYEHIPIADSDDLLALWKASSGKSRVGVRKVQLGIHKPKGANIAIGRSTDELLYSMESALRTTSSKDAIAKEFAILKHGSEESTTSPVAQLSIAVSRNQSLTNPATTFIFPQMAAVHAIESLSNSPAAMEIATFDPKGDSPEAARLAQDVVAEAHRAHDCHLTRSQNPTANSSSTFTCTTYNLSHPSLGKFTITAKTPCGTRSQTTGVKIGLHHPSATPAAVAVETLVLASLDLGRESCVFDTPGLLALGNPYIIDIAISALLAVAALEADTVMGEAMTFAAPPKSPYAPGSLGPTRRKKGYRRSRIMKKAKDEVFGEQVELPLVTRGALAIVGLSFKAALAVVEVGVKATVGVVGHIAKKI